MTTGDQALMLLEEANPVPDLESYGSPALSSEEYLSTLKEGITMTSPEPTVGDKTRVPAMWITAAAIALLVLGFAIVSNLDEEEVATTPVVTTAVTTTEPALDLVGKEITMIIPSRDVELVGEIDECPLAALRNDEPVQFEVPAVDASGAEWTIRFSKNDPNPFNHKIDAAVDDLSQSYRAVDPGPISENLGDLTVSYNMVMFNQKDLNSGDSIAATLAIECGE